MMEEHGGRSFPYEIRWARVEEWEPAIKMVWRTFLRFEASDYTEEGIQNFMDFLLQPRMTI